MESSGRYTMLSGLSGIIAGALALIGCYLTAFVWASVPTVDQNPAYLAIWISALVLAVAQDRVFAERKARKAGGTAWTPATRQALKALLPGMFLALVLSLRALTTFEYDAIPPIWILGYGVSLCAAGMFSIRQLRIFGVVQLITGAVAVFLPSIPMFDHPAVSLYLVALSFGVYHIIYGAITRRECGR